MVLISIQNSFAMEQGDGKKGLPLLEVGAGVGVTALPDYRGSDKTRALYLPIPYIIYRGDRVKVDRRGMRGSIYESKNTAINISGGFGLPVNSEKNEARLGMDDLDFVFHIGPSFEYLIDDDDDANSTTIFKFPVQLVLATNFSDMHTEGVLIYPHINYIKKANWHFGLSIGATFANKAYHDYYYSVAPQFATAERPAYTATSGYNGARIAMTFSKKFKKYWLGAFLRYDNLNKVAFDDSPLFKQKHSLLVGFGASYIFSTFP